MYLARLKLLNSIFHSIHASSKFYQLYGHFFLNSHAAFRVNDQVKPLDDHSHDFFQSLSYRLVNVLIIFQEVMHDGCLTICFVTSLTNICFVSNLSIISAPDVIATLWIISSIVINSKFLQILIFISTIIRLLILIINFITHLIQVLP